MLCRCFLRNWYNSRLPALMRIQAQFGCGLPLSTLGIISPGCIRMFSGVADPFAGIRTPNELGNYDSFIIQACGWRPR